MKSISSKLKDELEALESWMSVRRYSNQTISCYLSTLTVFFEYFSSYAPSEITKEQVNQFNIHYILQKKLSASYQSQFVNALKLFYRVHSINRIEVENLIRPKKPFQLPKVISSEEVAQIINATNNLKHKCMLSIIYSGGLRRGELLNLTITDIDSKRMLILIRQGKGMKDRVVPLSLVVLEMLRTYYTAYKPKQYLFEGKNGGRYSERSINLVFKKAVRVSGIKKLINLHILRHSYATHLMEAGTNLRYIQELLGHKSSRTTQIYTHVSTHEINKISSPIDKLNLKK
jgi:integrase/recombinase XerD